MPKATLLQDTRLLFIWTAWFCLFSTLVFGVCWELKFLVDIAIGKSGGIQTGESFFSYKIYKQIAILFQFGLIGIGTWGFLLLFSTPIVFLLMLVWVKIIRCYSQMDTKSTLLVGGVFVMAFLGTLIRELWLEYPSYLASPALIFKPSFKLLLDFLAFWGGLLLPRFFVRRLRLGVFCPEGNTK